MKAGLEEKEILILELIRSAPEPIGSWYIVNYLNEKGIRVSSATVGRVLNKLENQGYLQKEKFKGRVITEKGYQVIQYDHGLKQMADEQSKIVELIDHTQRSNLMNILNARLAIEPQLAAIAAETAAPEDHQRMLECLQAAEQNHSLNKWVADDSMSFHIAIAAATKNPILESFFKQLAILMMQDMTFQLVIHQKSENELEGHWGVYNAILAGDGPRAAAAMRSHIENLIRDVNTTG